MFKVLYHLLGKLGTVQGKAVHSREGSLPVYKWCDSLY